jgi:hypothetical protein
LTFRGSARDGEFWFRQAYDAARNVNARNSLLIATLHLGDLFTRMSSLSDAHEFLTEAADLADGVEKTKDSIMMELSFFGMHGRKELWSEAFRSIIRAETKLKKLLEPGFLNGLEKGEELDWVDRFANLRLSTGSPTRSIANKSPKVSRRLQSRKPNAGMQPRVLRLIKHPALNTRVLLSHECKLQLQKRKVTHWLGKSDLRKVVWRWIPFPIKIALP